MLDDLVAHGHVRFLGAVVRGQILATGTQVKGWFLGAALYCTDIVRFHAVTAGGGLSFAGARVDQRLEVSGSSEGKVAALRLNGARVGNFVDDEKSRPPAGELMLDGFVYDTIGDRNFGRDGEEEQEWFARMEWIHRQSNSSPKLHWYDWTRGSDYPYKPGPYTVFADFLDRRGRPNLAGKTRIERETRRARRKQLPRHRRLRLLLLWSVSRFGYEPERALYWLAAMPVLALCLDWLAAVRGPEWPAYWIVVDAIRTYATAAKNIVPLTNSHSKSFTEVLVTVLTVAILSVGGAGALRILARK